MRGMCPLRLQIAASSVWGGSTRCQHAPSKTIAQVMTDIAAAKVQVVTSVIGCAAYHEAALWGAPQSDAAVRVCRPWGVHPGAVRVP